MSFNIEVVLKVTSYEKLIQLCKTFRELYYSILSFVLKFTSYLKIGSVGNKVLILSFAFCLYELCEISSVVHDGA